MTTKKKIAGIVTAAGKKGNEADRIVDHARHLAHLHGYDADRAANQALYCQKYGVGLHDFPKKFR